MLRNTLPTSGVNTGVLNQELLGYLLVAVSMVLFLGPSGPAVPPNWMAALGMAAGISMADPT